MQLLHGNDFLVYSIGCHKDFIQVLQTVQPALSMYEPNAAYSGTKNTAVKMIRLPIFYQNYMYVKIVLAFLTPEVSHT